IPIFKISTMNEVLHESLARERFTVLLLTIFAGVALILSAVGIYGVMSYVVTQRTREIGLRLALGSDSRHVLRIVTLQGAELAITGVAIGLAGAAALTRLIATLLFDVGTADPSTYAIIAALLTGVALGASFIPARRAMKVDPMVALRYE